MAGVSAPPQGGSTMARPVTKWLLRTPYYGDAHEDAIAARVARYHAELSQLQGEIIDKPVAGVGDLVDRLIVLAHEADPSWDIEHAHVLPVLGGALACSGVLVSDCVIGEPKPRGRDRGGGVA